jgi:hypothetical protein
MSITNSEKWALKCLTEENLHDTEDRRLSHVDHLIGAGFARIERFYYSFWGGRSHKVREITITDAGRAALRDAKGKTE